MASLSVVALVSTLFFASLCLLTCQKVTLMLCLRMLVHQDVTMEQGYAVLAVLLATPYAFTLLLIIWNTPFLRNAKGASMPTLSRVALGIFSAIVEGACVVGFTTNVMAILPVFVALPATHGVMGVSTLLTSLKRSKMPFDVSGNSSATGTSLCAEGQPCDARSARIMASVICLLISPAVACFLYTLDLIPFSTALCLTFIPILLGLVWNRDLQNYFKNPYANSCLFQRRFRLLFVMVKLGSILFFLIAELYFRTEVSDSRETAGAFLEGFNIFKTTYVVVPLGLHFVASLLVYAMMYIALALRHPLFGITIPSLMSMVISLVTCVIFSPSIYAVDETSFFGPFPLYLVCASFLAWGWAWPFILNSSLTLRKPEHLLTPYKVLFCNYGWNPVFTEEAYMLSFGGSEQSETVGNFKKVKTRIYICTTMYREADYEMERLLLSLIQLSSDPLLQDTYFESNVFMDNGCSGEKLNEFAMQFVTLLVDKVNISIDSCQCWSTPYGMQISCQLPGGLSMFLHLKDPQKVKAKKRWSQSMYINYVMKYRKTLWRGDCDNIHNKNISKATNSLTNSCYSVTKRHQFFTTEETGETISNNFSCSLKKITNVGYPTNHGFSAIGGLGTRQHPDSSSAVNETQSSGAYSGTEISASPANARGEINFGFQGDDNGQQDKTSSKSNLPDFADRAAGENQPRLPQICHSICYDTIKEDTQEVEVGARKVAEVIEGTDTALVDDDHTFILATDADMDFRGDAVKELLQVCDSDLRVGAACGRTHPIGKRRSPIVWHQVFEYAKDFWMIKNAQNIIGSVSCCPGCFSLYRASALRDVMDKYSSPTRTPFTVYVKDTGEDRWMATLMMINGWRMRYSPFADNSTYCPDTFEEYYKQRRRWILSDMANAVLAVQNLIKLIRNNECFSLMYVIYLVNMFLNTVITPGTAIVMITAGLELVFDIPYVYTTLPMAFLVYLYAFLCTCTTQKTQVRLTNVFTVFMGGLFSSVALYGCYKITSGMVDEARTGNFRFQQHYMILLLALSLVYAALMHPKESYQIVYGFAYLFIFPAMHVLLPLYSIANIIDQSWGTRDSNQAKIPKMSCMPNFKRLIKRRKKSNMVDESKETDTKAEIQRTVSDLLVDMGSPSSGESACEEHRFWTSLSASLVGVDVNKGLEKAELAQGLRTLRNRTLGTFLAVNASWLALLSYFYLGADSPLARLNIYGVMSGALYGLTLVVQLLGLTASRIEQLLFRIAWRNSSEPDSPPVWIHRRENQREGD